MLRDLFYNIENNHLDLARILAFGSWFAVVALAAFKVATRQDVDVGDFANAMLSVLIGSGAVIASKDISRSIAIGKEKPTDYLSPYASPYFGTDEGVTVRSGERE